MGRPTRLVLLAVTVGLAIALGPGAPASADPPRPTDYRSEVTSIEPPVEGVELEILGGDSFIQLERTGDDRVDVIGYGGEPYLRFEPDGRVLENQRSPARYLNEDRYGDVALPPEADADAPPEWEQVASSGTYAWHDHRTHWMNPARPPGRSPGDQILEGVIPLRVGDRTSAVTVGSFWVPAPSPWPGVVGAALGLAGAVALVLRRPRTGVVVLVAVGGGVLALALGLASALSVPAATGPPLTLWALPLAGLVAAAGAGLLRGLQPPVRAALVAFSGVELAWWAWTRRTAVVRALVPTDAPLALDRAAVAGLGILALGIVVTAGRAVWATWPGRADGSAPEGAGS